MAKYPDFLKEGDEIRIVSPSGKIDPEMIDGAKSKLESWGFKASEGMFTRSIYGRFAGNEQERFTDLQQALDDSNVKAVLCSRGGYGLARIVDRLDFSRFDKNPKWLIGFSDITILHAALQPSGIISIHSSMAKQLAGFSKSDRPNTLLREILTGKMPTYKVIHNNNDRVGKTKGHLIGGNLSVMAGLRATPFDFNFKNAILFIEDTGEEPYEIDRMIQNLRLSGALASLSGLIVGQFSETEEDPEMHSTIYQLIAEAVKDYDYPISFGFSAGHIDDNLPVLMGSNVSLDVTEEETTISFQSTFWKKTIDLFK